MGQFRAPACLDDPLYIHEVETEVPGLSKYMPNGHQAMAKFIPAMDEGLVDMVKKRFAEIPGSSSFGVDGVTVNGNPCLLITETKGKLSRFVDLRNLEDLGHVTEEEAKTTAQVILKSLPKARIWGGGQVDLGVG